VRRCLGERQNLIYKFYGCLDSAFLSLFSGRLAAKFRMLPRREELAAAPKISGRFSRAALYLFRRQLAVFIPYFAAAPEIGRGIKDSSALSQHCVFRKINTNVAYTNFANALIAHFYVAAGCPP